MDVLMLFIAVGTALVTGFHIGINWQWLKKGAGHGKT